MTPFPCYQALCLDQAFCSEHAQLQGLNHSLCHHPLLHSLACLERHEQHSDIAGCGSPPTSDLALTWQEFSQRCRLPPAAAPSIIHPDARRQCHSWLCCLRFSHCSPLHVATCS